MKIFLSWSGDRSKAVAIALRDWLPIVLRDAAPWLSHTDIAAGERWSIEIAKELEASNFGIICLTKDNLTAPWILFEAGAVAKEMQDNAVVPYLYGVEFIDLVGPLSQFQSKKADKESTLAIVHAINMKSERPEDTALVSKRFELAWPDLEQKLNAITATTAKDQGPTRSSNEILEEVVTVMRSLDKRMGLVEASLRNLERNALMSADVTAGAEHLTSDDLGQSSGVVAGNAGLTIRQYRLAKGVTIKDLASAARISPSTLVRIEDKQIKLPSLDVVSRIANALGVSIDTFLTAKE